MLFTKGVALSIFIQKRVFMQNLVRRMFPKGDFFHILRQALMMINVLGFILLTYIQF